MRRMGTEMRTENKQRTAPARPEAPDMRGRFTVMLWLGMSDHRHDRAVSGDSGQCRVGAYRSNCMRPSKVRDVTSSRSRSGQSAKMGWRPV